MLNEIEENEKQPSTQTSAAIEERVVLKTSRKWKTGYGVVILIAITVISLTIHSLTTETSGNVKPTIGKKFNNWEVVGENLFLYEKADRIYTYKVIINYNSDPNKSYTLFQRYMGTHYSPPMYWTSNGKCSIEIISIDGSNGHRYTSEYIRSNDGENIPGIFGPYVIHDLASNESYRYKIILYSCADSNPKFNSDTLTVSRFPFKLD